MGKEGGRERRVGGDVRHSERMPREQERALVVAAFYCDKEGRRDRWGGQRRRQGSDRWEEIFRNGAWAVIFQQMLSKKPRRPSLQTGSQPHSLMNKGTQWEERSEKAFKTHSRTHTCIHLHISVTDIYSLNPLRGLSCHTVTCSSSSWCPSPAVYTNSWHFCHITHTPTCISLQLEGRYNCYTRPMLRKKKNSLSLII